LTGRQLGDPLCGHGKAVRALAFSPDGTLLASAGVDRQIVLWDTTAWKPARNPIRGHEGGVSCLAFSPDGTLIASGSEDKTVRVWNTTTGAPTSEPLTGHRFVVRGIEFSPDGRILASTSPDSTVRLWDAATWKPLAEPLSGPVPEGASQSVSFSPNGRNLATGGGDGSVRLWDTRLWRPTGGPIGKHEAGIGRVVFDPHGTVLASSSGDGSIRIWNAVPLSDRSGAIRTRLAQVDAIRAQLKPQIDAVGDSEADSAAFQSTVLGDPRFAGDLRTAALIVAGEVSLDRETKRRRRSETTEHALSPNPSDGTDLTPAAPAPRSR
jgi:hypothetical protein